CVPGVTTELKVTETSETDIQGVLELPLRRQRSSWKSLRHRSRHSGVSGVTTETSEEQLEVTETSETDIQTDDVQVCPGVTPKLEDSTGDDIQVCPGVTTELEVTETSETDVQVCPGVTLNSKSLRHRDRHPDIETDIQVCPGVTTELEVTETSETDVQTSETDIQVCPDELEVTDIGDRRPGKVIQQEKTGEITGDKSDAVGPDTQSRQSGNAYTIVEVGPDDMVEETIENTPTRSTNIKNDARTGRNIRKGVSKTDKKDKVSVDLSQRNSDYSEISRKTRTTTVAEAGEEMKSSDLTSKIEIIYEIEYDAQDLTPSYTHGKLLDDADLRSTASQFLDSELDRYPTLRRSFGQEEQETNCSSSMDTVEETSTTTAVLRSKLEELTQLETVTESRRTTIVYELEMMENDFVPSYSRRSCYDSNQFRSTASQFLWEDLENYRDALDNSVLSQEQNRGNEENLGQSLSSLLDEDIDMEATLVNRVQQKRETWQFECDQDTENDEEEVDNDGLLTTTKSVIKRRNRTKGFAQYYESSRENLAMGSRSDLMASPINQGSFQYEEVLVDNTEAPDVESKDEVNEAGDQVSIVDAAFDRKILLRGKFVVDVEVDELSSDDLEDSDLEEKLLEDKRYISMDEEYTVEVDPREHDHFLAQGIPEEYNSSRFRLISKRVKMFDFLKII
uniref:MYT1 domain-containing protein n=1 Tax=Macrostomum lignano TaxID=282301 RepID=A0A1I8H147_9PLAT